MSHKNQTKLITLDQAIETRLAEKRAAREEAARLAAGRQAEIERREQVVAVEARRILEAHYNFSLEGVDLKAIYQPAAHDDHHYNLRLYFPGEYGPHSVITNQAFPFSHIETFLVAVQWSALHVLNSAKDCRRENHHDLLDAIMFARFGSADPDEAMYMHAEDF